MASRIITGTFKNFANDAPWAYGRISITLNKSDYNTTTIYNKKTISVGLDKDGKLPPGFSLWCNGEGTTGSVYEVVEPDGTTWDFVLPVGGTPINIITLRNLP